MAVIIVGIAVVGNLRLRLTKEQIFETNRVRIGTVINGLSAGVVEKDGLYEEYDQLYIAKLENTRYYYNNFKDQVFNNKFAKAVAEYADMDSVAVIDKAGKVYGSWQCNYDFTKKRFSMLRSIWRTDGLSEPFSIAYEDGIKRFFGREIADDRILVFVKDWTETEKNIESMTSWEAVLRGMVSVDTVSIAVSLKDYSFLYNPIDNLTGQDALQNGISIESLGESYEGEMVFGGESWCVVGKKWKDAVVFVMTKADTNIENDVILLVFIGLVFIIFICLMSVYGIIINRDNIRIGKVPSYLVLLRGKTKEGEERHLLNFNLTVAGKILPIAIIGILAVTGISYYVQAVNGLASIAYESNLAIREIGKKVANNSEDAEAVNTEYKDMFLNKSYQLTEMLEKNPEYVLEFDPESENVHVHPEVTDGFGKTVGSADEYGNPCYSVSRQEFLQAQCH